MGPRAGLDVRKISSPPGFDPGPSIPVAQSLHRLSYPAHNFHACEISLVQRNAHNFRVYIGLRRFFYAKVFSSIGFYESSGGTQRLPPAEPKPPFAPLCRTLSFLSQMEPCIQSRESALFLLPLVMNHCSIQTPK